MGYHSKVPLSIVIKGVDDLKKYKEDNKVSDCELGRRVGVTQSLITKWRKGDGKPSLKSIMKLKEAGITTVEIPEEIRQRAIQKVLDKKDKGNMVKRAYTTRVTVPPIIANQVKLLVDDYMAQLEARKTYAEFQEQREGFIRKVYYLCRQG